jgi:uncharacterized protein
MFATYGLLFAAYVARYVPPVPFGGRYRLAPWQVLFIAAVTCGLLEDLLTWPATVGLAGLWIAASASTYAQSAAARTAATLLALAIAAALALHLVPGFTNPAVIRDVRLTADSALMTLKANFDKGAAGLILLAFFCGRPRLAEWPRVVGVGIGVGAATAAVVIGFVVVLGPVRFDPKWSPVALLWVPINLFLTCVFEEVLFRGLLQRSLTQALRTRPRWRWVPLAFASLVFGLVHAGGGPALVLAASLAGVGYGCAYLLTGRVESAVLAHFMLNATHFFLFTYPYAAR